MGSSSESSLSSTDEGIHSSVDSDSSLTSIHNFLRHEGISLVKPMFLDIEGVRAKLLEEDRQLAAAWRAAQASDHFGPERLNFEKTRLSTTLTKKRILNNFEGMFEMNHSRVCRIGLVTLSNVKVDYLQDPNSSGIRHYFVCALDLSNDCSLFLSQICEANAEGVVNFNINHTFSDLPADFKISVSIYVLKVERQSLVRRLLRRIERLFISRENDTDDTFHRESLFKFWRRTTITMTNVNQTKDTQVEIVFPQWRRIFVDVAGAVDTSGFSFRSWMSVSLNGWLWEYKWCVLKGTRLDCFNYLVEEQDVAVPVLSVDLKLCIRVRIGTPNRPAANRFILLKMNDEGLVFDLYMHTRSRYCFNQWKKLHKFVGALMAWKKANCSLD